MKYIDNNNAQTDKRLLENTKIPERNYFLNKPNNYSHEYLGFHDPDYFSLLKQYTQDSSIKDGYLYDHNANVFDLNLSSVKQKEVIKVPEKELNEKWLNQNEKILNSSDSILNTSDDEALENYLNDLAKNYDDIDRRIRNAEKFVTKMEESQNSNYNSFNGFHNLMRIPNYLDNGDVKSDKKMKYITELRVNISDNMAKEPVPNIKDTAVSTDKIYPKHSSSAQRIKHYREPVARNMSLIYINSNHKTNSNLLKSKCRTVSSNQNYINITSNCQSPKSKTSSLSNSAKLDLEYIDIPPPQIFCSYLNRNETVCFEKEIQTINLGLRSNLFSDYIYEDVAVQTAQVIFRDSTESVDKGVCTESEYFKPKLKSNLESISINSKNQCETNLEFSEAEKDDFISKSDKIDNSDIIFQNFQCDKIQMKSTLSKKLNERNLIRISPNLVNVQTKPSNKGVKPAIQNNLKLDKTEKRKKGIGSITKSFKMKNQKITPQTKIIKEVNDNAIKGLSKQRTDLEPEPFDTKDSTKHASFEIQRLLENLGTHLQASISMREPRAVHIKSPTSTDTSTASFWDNPLHKNDLISTKGSPVKIKSNDSARKGRKSNIINSELQAICKTIEKNKKYDNRSVNVSNLSCSGSESLNSVPNNIQTLRSESLDNRQIKKSANSPNRAGANIKKSASNINVSGDAKFPSNFKVFRSFELNPYDDIIKAHLSPFDRRVKSVAAKNACKIVIEGPINSYDPISCQAFRNKTIYRCTVAGPYKENLDKCMNYLKETFPNTFLKVNSRSG